ncbi:MAG: hypothetical protein IAG13_21465 [Deltaproteobacteria bacterium]|nr:hypothetical protein [Nannocystaceae bacterium]
MRRRPRPCTRLAEVLLSIICGPLGACSSSTESELPEPPEGAELVLEIGALQVYDATEHSLCAGTIRRIELHALGLAELFDIEPPRARVFVYDDFDVINEMCNSDLYVLGCAPSWGAHASPDTVTHELVHVFVHAATDQTRTWPAIQEGVAFRLDGARSDFPIIVDVDAELLAERSPSGLFQEATRHFFAWVIDEYGITAVLDAHLATSEVSQQEVAPVFARTLGFESVAQMQEAYVGRTKSEYPPLPDTARVFSADELVIGVDLDTSCAGALTEGPVGFGTGLGLHNVARLEIPQSGQYEVSHGTIPADDFDLRLRLDQPFDGVLYPNRPERCGNDQQVTRLFFETPGKYELNIDHALDVSFDATVRTRYLSGRPCAR